MTTGSTTVYTFNLPEVGGADSTWGGLLNSNWSQLDALLSGTNALTSLLLTGRVLSGDGAVSAPFLAASADPDTGFYRVSNGVWAFASDGVEAARLEAAGNALTDAQSIVTREKGDNRYLPLTGNMSFTGQQTQTGVNPVYTFVDTNSVLGGDGNSKIEFQTALLEPAGRVSMEALGALRVVALNGSLVLAADATNSQTDSYISMQVDGVLAARVYPAGTAADTVTTVVTREKGDARYAQLGVDNTMGGKLLLQNGSAAAPQYVFGAAPTTGMFNPNDGAIGFASVGVVTARAEVPGTAVPNPTSIITREKGDARYKQVADGIPIVRAKASGAGAGGISGASYNIASLTRTSTGRYTVAFTSAMSDANYVPLLSVEGSAPATGGAIIWYYGKTVNGFNIGTGDNSNDEAIDLNYGIVVIA